ncbi:MAG: lamin tail domain-containing protein [Candidatus Cloacimonetes bacterium]|nr:lamin tail domain-containing protein [Candidatus Cloacimonadota bacterium]MDY0366025.1 FlgD immunoglobulin-like domain containing protein [Candidatus Syntrophosphaera sp.]
MAIGTGYTGTVTCSSSGAPNATVSLSGTVTAPPPPNAPTATAATNVANTSFTANWNAVTGATGYYLDVYTKQAGTNASDLFFSEYIEGTSNNKAIEIYNGTGAAVDLSGYTVYLYTGGSATPTATLALSGNLANKDVYVIANSSAGSAILAIADITSGVANYNGNDALSLWNETTSSYADIFGCIGEDPGTIWGTDPYVTAEKTLVRKSSISGGVTSSQSGFPTLATEWDSYAQDTFTYLGSHTMAGGTTITYVSGYQNLNVNNVLTYNVTGLTAGTTYYYVVRAYNAYGTSGDSNEIEVTTTSTSPLITLSTDTLTGFTYMEGSGPSAEQNFTVSGSNLTANISIDAPTDYQISTGTGAAFDANMADPLTLTQSGGTVGTTTIYVRLKAGLSAGDYNSEVITASSSGADNKTVTCNGTVTAIPDPEITVSATTLSGFSYMVGSGPSAEQSFTVSGTYLTANISLDAPADYEISTGTGTAFDTNMADPIVLTAAKLDVAETTIYVRLKAGLAEGAYDGELITITSTDAETKTVILNGYVQTSDVPFLYWDFNDGAPGSGVNWTQPVAANYGTGFLTYTFANAVSFTGTTLNTMVGDVVNGGSFVPQGGTGNVNNGKEFVMTVNTTDLENITLTYATQRTSTGFTDQAIWYSLDGGQNYTLFTTFTSIASSWEVKEVDFSSVTGANDNPNFMVKIVLDGASGTQGTGNNRFDNISFFGDEEDVNPVELASFTATISAQNYITLTWVTQTETGMRGYYIYRDTDSNFAGAQNVSPLIPSANSSQMQTYMFEDTEVFETGTYFYWLQTNDMDGTVGFHGPVSVFFNALGDNPTPEIPLVTELKSVYPNPFNPVVFIPFSLAKDSNVSFKIYNARGQIVKHFELGSKAAGNYRITWDGTDYHGDTLSNGVYQIVMTAGSQVYQTKTTLLK